MRWYGWWHPPCLRRVVIANLIDDPNTALKGVLWESRGSWLTLRNVQLLKPGTEPLRVDGEVVIHRANVLFLQIP